MRIELISTRVPQCSQGRVVPVSLGKVAQPVVDSSNAMALLPSPSQFTAHPVDDPCTHNPIQLCRYPGL